MTIQIINGDCLESMRSMPENSVDAVVTDPPYGLKFMGKNWDHGIPGIPFWQEAIRIAKPGCHLLAFGGTRTFHRLVCAIEDAGWEIRDCLGWIYGSGFPKSYDISKGIDKQAGAEREVTSSYEREGRSAGIMGKKVQIVRDITAPSTPEAQLWHGWGTALKPAFEPIVVAMKPIDGTFVNNALTWGVAGLWIDGGRVGTEVLPEQKAGQARIGTFERENMVTPERTGRFPANVILSYPEDEYELRDDTTPEQLRMLAEWFDENAMRNTEGRSMKISQETYNKMPSDIRALFSAVPNPERDEVTGLFPQTGISSGGRIGNKGSALNMMGTDYETGDPGYGDSGSAARFFYCAKSSRSERNAGLEGMGSKQTKGGGGFTSPQNDDGTYIVSGDKGTAGKYGSIKAVQQNHHPTVKPLALMRYLARLTKTPTGGVVLDPFMGSGTTGMAAVLEGRDFIGIELNPEYLEIAERRIQEAQRTSTSKRQS